MTSMNNIGVGQGGSKISPDFAARVNNGAPPPPPPSALPIETFTQAPPQIPGMPPKLPPAVNAQPQAVTKVQPNQVKVTRLLASGQEVGMKAVLPALPGGGQLLPVNVSLEVQRGPQGEIAKAFVSDAQGNRLVNPEGQARELPVYKIDGKYLLGSSPENPASAPYILMETDSKGNIAYGLAEGLQYNNLQEGYRITSSELAEPDNSRVMRFNEKAGPLVQGGGNPMAGLGMVAAMTGQPWLAVLGGSSSSSQLGRSLDFNEVRISPQGKTSANDIHYGFLATDQRPNPDYMKKLMSSGLIAGREETSREYHIGSDGNATLAPASKTKVLTGWLMMKGNSMKLPKFPQDTITVRPLSSKYGNPDAQARLAQALTGGQKLVQEPPRPGESSGT